MSAIDQEYDVVVVGGRVAGAGTALQLARRGHRVLVVERAAYGSDTLSTHALMRGGVLQLHRWGVLDRIIDAATPPIRHTTVRYGDETVVVTPKAVGGVDALYAPRRTVLDSALVDVASEAGVEFRFGHSVDRLHTESNGSVVGVSRVAAGGEPTEVRSQLVIGADGPRSRVARSVGARPYLTGSSSGGMVYAYFAVPSDDGYEWCCRPGATAGVIPTNDGVLVWAGTSSSRFRDEVASDVGAGFHTLLREVAPPVAERLSDAQRTSRWRSTPGAVGYHRQSFGPGWALVGDAAHFKDPITSRGLTDALRDAELLAHAVDIGLRGGTPLAEALAWYQRLRDRLSCPIFAISDRIASYRWDLDEVRSLLMDLSAAMQDEVDLLTNFDVDRAV